MNSFEFRSFDFAQDMVSGFEVADRKSERMFEVSYG